jgi:hypothetical protein
VISKPSSKRSCRKGRTDTMTVTLSLTISSFSERRKKFEELSEVRGCQGIKYVVVFPSSETGKKGISHSSNQVTESQNIFSESTVRVNIFCINT